MTQLVRLIRDRHEGGEYPFVAGGLFMSFQLSRSLELELRTADSLWSGRSYRGDVKVMLPGEPRAFRHKKAARFAHLTVPEPLLARLGGSAASLRPHAVLTDVPLRHLMEAWLTEEDADRGAGNDPSLLFAESMLLAILGRLAALNGRSAAAVRHRLPPLLFKRARDMIESNLDRDLSVATLAHACGLSASHFAALFKASAGEPPHRYQTRRRVERARRVASRRV